MSGETVTIPAEMWKNSLVKIDELKAENERFRKAFKDIEAAWYKGRSSYVIAIVDDALAYKQK